MDWLRKRVEDPRTERFTIMTLEGWTNDVVNPVMEKHPYALLFFIPFIVITSFWVLNLFIGIIVNAMQEEHEKTEAEMMHSESAPLLRELTALKAEIAALRKDIAFASARASRPGSAGALAATRGPHPVLARLGQLQLGRLIEAGAVAVEDQGHQAAADKQREDDAETHHQPAP